MSPAQVLGGGARWGVGRWRSKIMFAEEMVGSPETLHWEENNLIKYAQQGRNGLISGEICILKEKLVGNAGTLEWV